MDWSLGNIIRTGLRVIQHRNDVARVAQKMIAQINQAEELWGEVREVIGKVAPELLVDLHVVPAVPPPAEPTPEYDVKWVQEALNHLLHPNVKLKVDGKMGEQTRGAIEAYQRRKGLDPDGWLGPLTMAALNADIEAAHGSRGR